MSPMISNKNEHVKNQDLDNFSEKLVKSNDLLDIDSSDPSKYTH